MADAPAAAAPTEAPADNGIAQKPTLLNTPVDPATPTDPAAPTEPKEGDKPAPHPFDIEKLEVPEGFEIPEDKKTALTEIATKHGLSNDAMKELIALQSDTMKAKAEQPYKLWQDTQKGWQDTVRADQEIGGDKLPATLQTVSKALDQYGTPGVRSALDFTGAGNNPEIVKTIFNMAKALGEAGHVTGAPPNQSNVPRTAAEAIYPGLSKG